MRNRRGWTCLALGLTLAGCARSVETPAVAPADIGSLEAARQARPDDPAVLTRLGIAYYNANDYARAKDVLLSSLALDRGGFSAAVYLGLAYEELGQLDSARAAYERAANMNVSSSQRGEVQNRLALLTRKELQQQARQALAQEAVLSRTPPTENTVAVFPFRYVGSNEDLKPLEVGLSHLIITDLSRVSQLRLLERERVQVLLDEMALAESGRVQAATGARSGRLLRAARVVQGAIQDQPGRDDLRVDASVVDVTTSEISATSTATDPLQQLFDAEKQIVLGLLERMGITLSPAERRAISERPTADLQAFLAFSRGLEAEDRGDFSAAAGYYNAALARDPNFRAARERRTTSLQMSSAMTTPPAQLAGLRVGAPIEGRATRGGAVVAAVTPRGIVLRNLIGGSVPSFGGLIDRQIGGALPPIVRPPLPEVLDQDDPRTTGLTGQVIIIITRP